MIKYSFGHKIREIREKKGITLKTVSKMANVSESLISQIETNKISPSIDTLFAVADALEIDFDYLFNNFRKNKKVSIVRKKERKYIKTKNIKYEQISVVSDFSEEHEIEAFLMEIKQNGEKGSNEYGHIGKELGLILEGKGILKYGTEEYTFDEGDCISFSSDIPHTIKNTGKCTMKVIWMITPPKMLFFKD